MFKRYRKIHFVGIGGAGMSGIAEVLLTLGYEISGSDLKASEVTERLRSLGARVEIGHRAEHAQGADAVVVSTAVRPQNPEVVAARQAGLPVIPRAEMLAELARLKYTVAVAGTHGKTTTTSLVASVLHQGGLDPTVIIGGRLKQLNTGARVGKGEFLVAEADESDGSFLKLNPTLAVLTNIDNDHLDYYGSMKKLREAFASFAQRVPFYGSCVAGTDDPEIRGLLPHLTRRTVTYAIHHPARWQARDLRWLDGRMHFRVLENGRLRGSASVPLAGPHNVRNALAALAVAGELDIPFEKAVVGLAAFEGVGRRLEWKGEEGGVQVFDDYGHHPTEIEATLEGLREICAGRRLVVLFQPHRYTRTKALAREFARSLHSVPVLRLLDIYPAGEKPIPGVSLILIERGLRRHPDAARFHPAKDMERLARILRSGDTVLTLGAGDVWKTGETLLSVLRNRPSPAAS